MGDNKGLHPNLFAYGPVGAGKTRRFHTTLPVACRPRDVQTHRPPYVELCLAVYRSFAPEGRLRVDQRRAINQRSYRLTFVY